MAGKNVMNANGGCRRRWLRLCGLALSFAALAPDPAAAARFKLRLRASHGEPFSAGRADPPSERSEAKPKPAGAAEAAAARARAALAAEQAGGRPCPPVRPSAPTAPRSASPAAEPTLGCGRAWSVWAGPAAPAELGALSGDRPPPRLRVKTSRGRALRDWTNAAGPGRDEGGPFLLQRGNDDPTPLGDDRRLLAPVCGTRRGPGGRGRLSGVQDGSGGNWPFVPMRSLVRLDDQLSRRLSRASRQLAFGPYVGLRVWQSDWRQQRAECSADRACLATAYNDANRFLDRFQRCLGTSLRGRRCLPVSVEAERSAVRRP